MINTDFKSQASWLDQARKMNDRGEQAVSDNQIVDALIQQRPELSQSYSRLRQTTKDHPESATKFLNYTFYGDANYAKPIEPPKPLHLGGLVSTESTNPMSPFSVENQVPQKPLSELPIVGGTIGTAQEIGQGMMKDIQQAGENARNTSGRSDLNILGKTAGVVGDLTFGGANVLAEPFKPIVKGVTDLLNAGSQYAEKNYGPSITALNPEQKAKMQEDLANMSAAYDHFSTANPNIAASLKGVAGIVSMALAAQGVESTVNSVGNSMESLGKGAIDTAKKIPKVIDATKASSLEKAILAGKNPPIEEVAQHPELFKKYADKYGVKDNLTAGDAVKLSENAVDDLNIGQVDNVEATRVKILKDAQDKASLADVQKSVMPPTTKKNFQDANANLKNEGSFFKAPSLNATESQLELAKVAKSLKSKGFSPKNSPIANEKVVQNSWSSESKDLLAKMKANDAISPDQEIVSAIKKALEKQGLSAETGVGKKVMSAWEDSLAGNSNGKISGHWGSKIDFSKEAVRKWGNSIYEKGTDLADAVNASHEAVNSVISTNASRAGIDYTGQMERLTKIHKIIENLKLQQSGDALRSTAGNLVRNPLVKIGVGATGLAGAAKLIP